MHGAPCGEGEPHARPPGPTATDTPWTTEMINMPENTMTPRSKPDRQSQTPHHPSGTSVASFTLACTPHRFDKLANQWRDGETTFLPCNRWRNAAENLAQSLTRGARVIVTGRLRHRTFQTREGDKRTVYELEVEEIGASLRHATVQVVKATHASNSDEPPF